MVSIFNKLNSFSANKHGYKHASQNIIRKGVKMSIINGIHSYFQDASIMETTKMKVPLFVPTFLKCIWVEKSPQVCKIIA